jgi:hypothetical protein
MTDDLILPVPELLHATYLVPTALGNTEAKARTQSALPTRVPAPVGTAAGKMLGVGAVHVESFLASALPPVPAELQEHLGVASSLVQVVAATRRFSSFSAAWPPGWPPVHEAAARACAAALAAALSVPLVDSFVPKVMSPEAAIAALPDAESRLRLSDWVLVFQSAGRNGLWMTTKGMGRFGLPELQVHDVPPHLGTAWTGLLLGVGARLLDHWLDALRVRDDAAFVQFPAVIAVAENDVADAYGATFQDGRGIHVRLRFDPALEKNADSFLTIQPPDDFQASAGEYLAHACAEIFGDSVRDIRYLPPTKEMERVVESARAALSSVRSRFLSGDLPLNARLMVKHTLKTPHGTEHPWAYVNSWSDPVAVLGNSTADAVHDPRVRAGRPVVISADAIIDWAVWIDGQGIVEGGSTNVAALSHDR